MSKLHNTLILFPLSAGLLFSLPVFSQTFPQGIIQLSACENQNGQDGNAASPNGENGKDGVPGTGCLNGGNGGNGSASGG
ncbi:hypothetical protein [Pantoea sp. 1B4]|nr:hypothetical protein [Pantoea sp. 1B4]